jgi:hypothetical protein
VYGLRETVVFARKITVVSEKQAVNRHCRINYNGVVIAVNIFIRRMCYTNILGREVCAIHQNVLTPPVGIPGIYFVRIIS